MTEPLATVYIRFAFKVYRFKVFKETVMIERQSPHGANLSIKHDDDLYDVETQAWTHSAIQHYIAYYESEIAEMERK